MSFLREGVDEYIKRLAPYVSISITELGELKKGDKLSNYERLKTVEAEGERMLKLIKDTQYMILLDVHGKALSSEGLADLIETSALDGNSDMVFVIGGAFGVSDALRRRANLRLSFSPMTFTHQMIRLLLLEQLYRTCKIRRNEPYHW